MYSDRILSNIRTAASSIGPRRLKLIGVLAALFLLLWAGLSLYKAPADFPTGSVFTISPGSSISSVAENLKNRGLISSSFVFEKLVVFLGKEKAIIAGDYYFPAKFSVLDMARRITRGAYGMVPARVTVPEGFSNTEIVNLFQDSKYYKFNRSEFLLLAKDKEGYLFPDTYFFMPTATSGEVIQRLSDNFDEKLEPYYAEFSSSTHSFGDIIKVASILEKEVASSSDRKIVAGIIWRRLKLGMPLQVDATLGYVLNKGTFQLTQDDLKLDNPYNTYVYKGLPPTPIGNPGLDSIDAALHPSTTKYLYYLSDKRGKIYYANTFEEHKRNRELYLGK